MSTQEKSESQRLLVMTVLWSNQVVTNKKLSKSKDMQLVYTRVTPFDNIIYA